MMDGLRTDEFEINSPSVRRLRKKSQTMIRMPSLPWVGLETEAQRCPAVVSVAVNGERKRNRREKITKNQRKWAQSMTNQQFDNCPRSKVHWECSRPQQGQHYSAHLHQRSPVPSATSAPPSTALHGSHPFESKSDLPIRSSRFCFSSNICSYHPVRIVVRNCTLLKHGHSFPSCRPCLTVRNNLSPQPIVCYPALFIA